VRSIIREAVDSDLEAIVAIYNAAIPGRMATADTEPVTVEARREWLRDRDYSRHPIWVAERNGQVVGWLSLGRFYGRPAYAATAEVGIYVDPKTQRAGIASGLMSHAIAQAPRLLLSTFLGFIFAHNVPSLSLFRKFGFEEWGRLPRVALLDGVQRDLLVLGKRVEGSPAEAEHYESPGVVRRDRNPGE
jgi:phosphinothricin acetyltransferase